MATPLGAIAVVASPAGVVATALEPDAERALDAVERWAGAPVDRDDRGLAQARDDVRDYFAGSLRVFSVAVDLDAVGRGFARSVYAATMRVPYGQLRTYGDVAADAGAPRAFRAAGTALHHCPIELWIPCHRVVPAGPGFGTYGGHPERREFLLRLERAI